MSDIGMFLNKYKFIRKIAVPLYLIATVGFSGCSTTPGPGMVYKEWSQTMSQEGIFPVFPPREDIQVGDVWLLPVHPLKTDLIEHIGGLGQTGIWYQNIFCPNSKHAVSNFYSNRSAFPRTSSLEKFKPKTPPNADANGAGKSNTMDNSQNNINKKDAIRNFLSGNSNANLSDVEVLTVPGTSTPSSDVFQGGEVGRLRQVAFPEFAVTKLKQADMQALLPIEYFNVAGGVAFSAKDQISLKIPLAESYGMPLTGILRYLDEDLGITIEQAGMHYDNNKSGMKGEAKRFAGSLCLANTQFKEMFEKLAKRKDLKGLFEDKETRKDENFIWVALITEVYYARAMDISITRDKGVGGGAKVQPITDDMLNTLQRLDNLKKNKKLSISTTPTTPGTSTGSTSGSTGSANTTPTTPGTSTGSTSGSTGSANTTPTMPETTTGSTSGSVSSTNTPTTPGTTTASTQSDTLIISEDESAVDIAKKLSTFAQNTGNQTTLGGSINVVSVSTTGVGLRRIYDSPIAVGVRGVLMKIDVTELRKLLKSKTNDFDFIPIE